MGSYRFPVNAYLLLGFIVSIACAPVAHAGEARIYVVHQADGSIRFTNKPPVAGEAAEVFTAKSNVGSFRRVAGGGRAAYSLSGARASLRPSYFTSSGSSAKIYPHKYADVIDEAADLHQVDPALVRAVIHAESAFNPHAVSPKGARGLMQLMPSTAKMLGVRNAFSPESNIHGGTRYLAQLLKRYRNEIYAIAAYNAGLVPVDRYNGVPPFTETQEYVRRVLKLKKQYSRQRNG
jgi:soluble lytic murein transglycosylase-like protein